MNDIQILIILFWIAFGFSFLFYILYKNEKDKNIELEREINYLTEYIEIVIDNKK